VSFRSAGFAPLAGFLEPSELAPLRAEVNALLASPLPPGCERPHNTLAPLRWDDPIVTRVVSSERRRAALAEAIDADDLRWISGYVSVKEAASAALWWHQDWWCWDHPVSYVPAASQVAVLCYLSDTTASEAALRVLPGTHHRSVPLHAALPEAHTAEAGDIAPEHAALRDHPDQLTLEMRAGDAVVIDYRLLHGTHLNAGRERRDCLLLSFTPSWRSLPDELRAHLVRHPALPLAGERPADESWPVGLLPHYDGEPRDLSLNRVAPSTFEIPRGQ
jgi:ectoine hydroxylase-related dioxygenase (phytanoyl-CoA dioxygenase family)